MKVRAYRSTRLRVDVDNLLKPTLDAGNAIIWEDDSQVSKGITERLLDRAQPRLEILIWRMVPAVLEVLVAP